jgi:hypothetical protein
LKILKPSSNYLKNTAQKNLALALLCATGTFIIIFSSVPNLPFYIDAGKYEAARGTFSLLPFIIGILYWRKYNKYKLGYEGEKQVTESLKLELSDDYHLINDVSLPSYNRKNNPFYDRRNIDHIVLSPNGVFAIETKNQRGKITCYGDEWLIRYRGKNRGSIEREFNFTLGSPSAQVRNNAFRVKTVIESLEPLRKKRIWVQGLVVFPNKDAELDRNELPDNVEVFYLNELSNYLKNHQGNQGKQFSLEEMELIEKEILRQAKIS